MKRGWIIAALVVVGFAATVYPLMQSRKKASSEGEVVPVTRGQIAVRVEEVGSVEPLRKVEIKSKVSGQVREVLVDVGDRVKDGQVLMRLDTFDADREVREAKVRVRATSSLLGAASAQYEYKRKAHDLGALSDLDLSVALGEVKRLRAQREIDSVALQGARDRWTYTQITAPIDGVVLARNVQPGEMVAPGGTSMVNGSPLLVVAQIEKLLVRTELNQVDVARISPRGKVDITVDALPGKKFVGEIYRIAVMAQKSERRRESNLMVFPVDVIIDRTQPGADALRPGMMADISVALEMKDGVLLAPIEAVVREQGKTKVWRVGDADSDDQSVDVTLGLQNEREVELVGGIAEGERIRVRPASAEAHTAKM